MTSVNNTKLDFNRAGFWLRRRCHQRRTARHQGAASHDVCGVRTDHVHPLIHRGLISILLLFKSDCEAR